MQGIHRKERENSKSKQKEKNTLDSYRPSHGRRLSGKARGKPNGDSSITSILNHLTGDTSNSGTG